MARELDDELLGLLTTHKRIGVHCASQEDALASLEGFKQSAQSAGVKCTEAPTDQLLPRCFGCICAGCFVEFSPCDEISFLTMAGRYTKTVFSPAALRDNNGDAV